MKNKRNRNERREVMVPSYESGWVGMVNKNNSNISMFQNDKINFLTACKPQWICILLCQKRGNRFEPHETNRNRMTCSLNS